MNMLTVTVVADCGGLGCRFVKTFFPIVLFSVIW